MILRGLDRQNKPIEVEIEGKIIKRVTFLDQSEAKNLNQYIIPGFIDIHTHGGYGKDLVDNSMESIRTYLRELPIEGTTSIVQASITTPYDNLLNTIRTAKSVMDNPKEDEIRYLGINIEGNFLNKAKKGAHKEELLVPLEKHHVDEMSKQGNIRLISAAYENSTPEVIEHLTSKGIVGSLAHTIATGKEVEAFMKVGLKGITHMFNAMTPFSHREDTAVLRGLIEDELYTEIIVDGIHVHPNTIKLLFKQKSLNKILIITDSAPAKGMPDGDYKFGELEIYKTGNTIRTKIDDALAGSIATMHQCFINFMKFTGATLEEASITTSTNQAEYLNLEKLGLIKEGYFADILILDKDYSINKTISNGNTLYRK